MTQKSSSKSKKSSARSLRLVPESGVSTRSKVIKRRPGKGKSDPENIVMEDTSVEKEAVHQEEVTEIETQTEPDLMVPSPVEAEEGESPSPADETKNSAPTSPVLPKIIGFDLSGMGLSHQYSVRCDLVLCDCCVQTTAEGTFEVLGRNFNDTGALMWWLRRIGKGHLAELLKGKDIVDAARKAAHGLSRELKEEIGRPVPRW